TTTEEASMTTMNVTDEMVQALINTRLPSGGYPSINEVQAMYILRAVYPFIAAAALRDIAAHFIDWEVMHGHEEATPEIERDHKTARYLEEQADYWEAQA